MFERIFDEEERGQVGIGTLIVFIAMVLVAAIAAGVLINTAGFLQTQAEATGEESTSQVVDRMEVQSAVGEVGGIDDTSDDLKDSDSIDPADDGPLIYQVDLTVTKAPGADDVDLDEATAELITDDGVNQVVLEEDLEDVDNGEPVEIDAVTAESEDNIVLTDAGDRYTISFYGYQEDGENFATAIGENAPNDAAWIGDLEGGDSMEVRLTTAAGATTTEEVRVPDSLVDRDAVSL